MISKSDGEKFVGIFLDDFESSSDYQALEVKHLNIDVFYSVQFRTKALMKVSRFGSIRI